jgi:hypothetical protein
MRYHFFKSQYTHYHYIVRGPKGQRMNFRHHYLTSFLFAYLKINPDEKNNLILVLYALRAIMK